MVYYVCNRALCTAPRMVQQVTNVFLGFCVCNLTLSILTPYARRTVLYVSLLALGCYFAFASNCKKFYEVFTMTNFYAYINRKDYREAQAIYEADLERKRIRKEKIERFYIENTTDRNTGVCFKALAFSDKAIILKDDMNEDIWVAILDKNYCFRLQEIRRCSTINQAKELFYNIHEDAL